MASLDGLYEVSNLGGFRSLYTDPPRAVKAHPNPDGYLIVTASIRGRKVMRKLHRLVCEAFHGPPNILHREAAHLDGNRANACADNLKWVSKRENASHRKLHGTDHVGERHPGAKLTEASVKAILDRLAAGESCCALASEFGVAYSTIESIMRRKNWRHVRGPKEAYSRRYRGRRIGGYRGQAGERNHQAKLTCEQVMEMRRRAAAGERVPALAAEFGIGRASAYKAVRGDTYANAGGAHG